MRKRVVFFMLAILLPSFLSSDRVCAQANGAGDSARELIPSLQRNLPMRQAGFVSASVVPYLSQWVFVFTVNRELGHDIRRSNAKRWLKNVGTFPQIRDGDSWLTNFLGHPLMGANLYHFYRTRGFSTRQSFWGTFLQSTLFEYTVEAWKQPPSGVDLLVTPTLGSLLGKTLGDRTFMLSSLYAAARFVYSLF